MDKQDWYQLFQVLHIISAVVAFGFPMLMRPLILKAVAADPDSGLGVRKGAQEVAEKISTNALYGVFVFGVAMAAVSSQGMDMFQDTWLGISVLLYLAIVGIIHAVLRPSGRKVIAALEAGDSVRAKALEKRIDTFGPLVGVLMVVTVYLMVFKPGN